MAIFFFFFSLGMNSCIQNGKLISNSFNYREQRFVTWPLAKFRCNVIHTYTYIYMKTCI